MSDLHSFWPIDFKQLLPVDEAQSRNPQLQYFSIRILHICMYFSLDFVFQLSFCFHRNQRTILIIHRYVVSTEIARIIRDIISSWEDRAFY